MLEGSPDLSIMVTEQIFQTSEKMPSSIKGLKRRKIGYIREAQQLYNNEADMPSGPQEILFFNLESA